MVIHHSIKNWWLIKPMISTHWLYWLDLGCSGQARRRSTCFLVRKRPYSNASSCLLLTFQSLCQTSGSRVRISATSALSFPRYSRGPTCDNGAQNHHDKQKTAFALCESHAWEDNLGAWHRKFALHWSVHEFHSVSFGWMILPISARALSKATELQGWTTRRTHPHLGLGSAWAH